MTEKTNGPAAFALLGTFAVPKPRAKGQALMDSRSASSGLYVTRPFRQAERRMFSGNSPFRFSIYIGPGFCLDLFKNAMTSIFQSLKHLLDTQKGERKVVQFLAQHPQLLCNYFVTLRGHCQYVLTEVSLGGEFYMDAVVLTGHSGAWDGYFIEFEPVADKVFNKDGTLSARTKKAFKQIADWREHMRLNLAPFRRTLAKLCQTKDRLGEKDSESEPCTESGHRLKDPETVIWEQFWIISGRRKNLSHEVRGLMARQQTESDVFMARFLDLAEKISKQTTARRKSPPVAAA
jgi:hypothetical protein